MNLLVGNLSLFFVLHYIQIIKYHVIILYCYRMYTISQPLMAPPLPVKINTGRPMLVPYYSGPTLMDDGVSEVSRPRTWRSRKADYGGIQLLYLLLCHNSPEKSALILTIPIIS